MQLVFFKYNKSSFNLKYFVLAYYFGFVLFKFFNTLYIFAKYLSFWYSFINSSLLIRLAITTVMFARCDWWDNASAITLSLPGLYLTSKLLACNISNQWACLLERLCCVLIYSREVWFVIIINFYSSRYDFQSLITYTIASNSFSWTG